MEVCAISSYANDFPYQKYGFNRESARSGSDSEGSRFLNNKLRDNDNRLKANSDFGRLHNLDSQQNAHNLQNFRRGNAHDNLTHIQGQNSETDKSHKVNLQNL